MATKPDIQLKERDKAPVFTAATSGNGEVSLSEFIGKQVVNNFG